MRIAFIAHRLVYPPDGGTAMRNYHLIRQAAKRHDVLALAFADATKGPGNLLQDGVRLELVPPPPNRTLARRLLLLIATRNPDLATRSYSPELLSALSRKLPAFQPHVVQVQSLDMAYVVPLVRKLLPLSTIVLDEHNAEYMLQRRAAALDARVPLAWHRALYSLVQSSRLARYEADLCRACDIVLAVSEEDRRALRALAPKSLIEVVPNGIDLSEYEGIRPHPHMGKGIHFVFTGKMDFRPNVDAVLWFARSIWPLVKEGLPHAQFWVVGRDPVPSVRALAAQPGIHVTGPVQDARPYIAAASVFVAPLRLGGGTKLKILEAAALHRPIVATRTALEGLPAVPGRDCLVEAGAEGFARACQLLAQSPSLAASLGENAWQHIAAPADWSIIYRRLESIYAHALHR